MVTNKKHTGLLQQKKENKIMILNKLVSLKNLQTLVSSNNLSLSLSKNFDFPLFFKFYFVVKIFYQKYKINVKIILIKQSVPTYMKKVFCLHHPHFARPLFTDEIECLMFICCQQSVECHVNKFTLNMPKKKNLIKTQSSIS